MQIPIALTINKNQLKRVAVTVIISLGFWTGESWSSPNQEPAENKSWSIQILEVGTNSSPRAADLNRDGILDIVVGAGKKEFEYCNFAVIALDGSNGTLLWKVDARDQIFGSASFKDITGDQIPDVFIGGRSAELMAIDGSDGKVIWEFFPRGDTVLASDYGLYNFYNPQFIPDQDGDGVEDILVANGGDVNAVPYDPNRPAGKLMVINSLNGKLIAQDTVPDGGETYMSAVVADLKGDGNLSIAYGTGGETIGGNYFIGTMDQLLDTQLSSSHQIDSSQDKGFVGPPVIVDITEDGILDVVVNAVDGRMIAIDGSDNSILWTVKMPNTEAYTSIAVGYFNQDSVPDFFASYAVGVWPRLEWARQFMVNGKTSEVEFIDSLGYSQTCSPVVADLDNDGFDEAILSVNFFVVDSNEHKSLHHSLVTFDFNDQIVQPFGYSDKGLNLSSTPWIGDLDNDGRLDIVYCYLAGANDVFLMKGLTIKRIITDIKISAPLLWGSYMGSNYDGIFPANRPASH